MGSFEGAIEMFYKSNGGSGFKTVNLKYADFCIC